MSHYLRVDHQEDFIWMNKIINSLMSRNPNDPFLMMNYGHLVAWRQILDEAVSTKSTAIPEKIVVTEDKEEIIPSVKKPRGRPANKRNSKAKKPAVIIQDIFMCEQHPNRTGIQHPRDDCKKCWEIYKQFHPNEYAAARRKWALKYGGRYNAAES